MQAFPAGMDAHFEICSQVLVPCSDRFLSCHSFSLGFARRSHSREGGWGSVCLLQMQKWVELARPIVHARLPVLSDRVLARLPRIRIPSEVKQNTHLLVKTGN